MVSPRVENAANGSEPWWIRAVACGKSKGRGFENEWDQRDDIILKGSGAPCRLGE